MSEKKKGFHLTAEDAEEWLETMGIVEMESGQPLNLTEEQKKSGVFVRLRSPKKNPQK